MRLGRVGVLFEHARNGPLDDGFISLHRHKPRVAENLCGFWKLLCVVRILRREGQNANGEV